MQNVDQLTQENDFSGRVITHPEETGSELYTSHEANKKREQSADESTVGEAINSFGLAFRELNGAANIWDFIEFDSYSQVPFTEDKNFVKNWNDTSITQYRDQMGFGIEQHARLSEATSSTGLAFITKGIQQDMAIRAEINDNITKGWETTANMTGAVLDLDLAFPLGKVGKAKSLFGTLVKEEGVISNIRSGVAAQAAWETSHSLVNDDYTTADAMLGFSGMVLFTGALTKFQLSRMNANITSFSPTVAKAEAIPVKKWSTKPIDDGASAVDDLFENYKWTRENPALSKLEDIDTPLSTTVSKMDDEFQQTMKVTDDELITTINKSIQTQMNHITDMVEEAKNIIRNMDIDGTPAASRQKTEVEEIIDIVRKESGDDALDLDNMLKSKLQRQKDGSFRIQMANGKLVGKKIPAVVAAALVGTTAANASEVNIGGSDVAAALMIFGIALVGGGAAWSKFRKNNGTLSSAMDGVKQTMHNTANSVKVVSNNKIAANIQKSSAVLETRLTNTVNRFLTAGGRAKEMGEKLLVNWRDGTVQSAEIMKRRFARIAEAAVAETENVEFVNWLKTVKNKEHHPVLNFIENNRLLDEFRMEIADAVDGLKPASPEANKVAKEFVVQMRMLYDEAVKAGMKGFVPRTLKDGTVIPAIKFDPQYIPRYWRTADMRQLISGASGNRAVIKSSVAAMIQSAAEKRFAKQHAEWAKTGEGKEPILQKLSDSEKLADNILKGAEGESVGKKGRITDNSIARLEAQMAEEGIEMSDAMRKSLGMEADKTARAMYRIDMDYKAFKPFKVMIGGVEQEVKLSDLMDRDSHSIMSRYANEMGGQIALGKAGYDTVADARNAASKIHNLELREDMNLVIDSLAGEDMVGMTLRQKQVYEVMTGVAFIGKLPLVTVSMLTEFAKILTTKNGMISMLNSIGMGMASRKEYKAFLAEMRHATGQATASLRHEVNPKGIDDISNITDQLDSAYGGTMGTVSNTVRQGKEAASRYYGLLKFNDFLQEHALFINTKVLSEMLYRGRKMSATRMQQYGITEAILEDFRKSKLLKLDGDGDLLELNWEKFSDAQRDAYVNMTFRMNQNLTQETTLGGTAMYMHSDYFFRSMSYLLTFPAEAFSNHGIRDIVTGDAEAFRSMFAMYAGGYISLKARYAIDNKDVSDEEVAYRAMIGMPIFGALGTATGITDPVVLSFFQNMADMIKLSNYEDKVVED